ncbi:MAG: protein-disulfide reductase DsbD domain-containing protein [Candidatus Phaeomarinobacter sp.]
MALAAAPAAVPDAHAQASRFGDRFATSQVEPGASAWDKGLTSRMRLISAHTGALPAAGEDVVHAGIEITLDPKWKTYWSTPGDTGIAPVFSFARSTNVASVDVNYPMPQRFDLPGDISFGYENQVVFPVSVTPKTSGGAITLIADVVYGACEELCIPVEATAELEFTAAPGAPGRFADILAQWQARVPSDHDARLDAVKPMMRDGEMHLEVAIAAPAALVDPLLIAEPTGGGGRVYLGTPDRSIDGNRATFMFPVKTRRNHAGLEGGVEFAFTVADKGQEPGGWWAQRFEYLLLPHNGTRTAGDSSAY